MIKQDMMRDRLIVGLDVPTLQDAEAVVEELGETVSFYKIGYQLIFMGGLGFAYDLVQSGKKVFLDVKLLDIDNTVAKSVENIAEIGVSMLTLHAYPKVMRAGVNAAKGSNLSLLAVTVLTSMDKQDLMEAGYHHDPQTLVLHRAQQACDVGMNGIVCSAIEAAAIRTIIGPAMTLVTPGIRSTMLPATDIDDQKRIMIPKEALRAGSDYLVIGRPIIKAVDRLAAVRTILTEMAARL